MDYRSGSAADQHDLLAKIKILLQDNGWTINKYSDDDSTYRSDREEQSGDAKRLHATNGTQYLNFRSTEGANACPIYVERQYGILCNMGSGYSSDSWCEQPGVPSQRDTGNQAAANLYLNGACSYELFYFDDPFTLLVCVTYSAGIYGQLYFGTIPTKYGAWTGGDIFLSSTEANQVFYDDFAKYGDFRQSFLSPKINYVDFHYWKITSVGNFSFKGALNLTAPTGILPTGCAWATHGGYDGTDYADDLLVPFVGFPTAYNNGSAANTSLYCNDMHGPLFQSMPPAVPGPLLALPIQPGIYRDSTSRISLLGELPHLKITCLPPEAVGATYTVGGTTYKIVPLGSPAINSTHTYVNPMLAVEYGL